MICGLQLPHSTLLFDMRRKSVFYRFCFSFLPSKLVLDLFVSASYLLTVMERCIIDVSEGDDVSALKAPRAILEH